MKKVNMVSKYSKEVKGYLEELRRVAGSLDRIGEIEQIFQRCLMVFMDDGWGYEDFLESIAEELAPFYGASSDDVYFHKFPESFDKGVAAWERNSRSVKSMSEKVQMQNTFAILSCDLREFMDELSNPSMVKSLKTIVENGKRIFIVFRFPYMKGPVGKELQDRFFRWFSVRSIVVPPISLEEKKCCIRDYLEQGKFRLEEDAEEVLEKWILQNIHRIDEGGYPVLKQMAGDLIYQSALRLDNSDDFFDDFNFLSAADVEVMLNNPENEQDAYELLNELIGMAELKAKIREIVAQIKMQKEWEKQGKDIGTPTMHMLFYGNPGTGKTTLARVLGQIFKQEGLLSKGDFKETTGSYFVEGLISELMKKTRETCKEAHGSVLFIDEAYGMSVGYKGGNTAEDILPIFVAEMENYREDMCVIFAGYEEEMEEFLRTNSGLKSRIPHILRFPNYSKEELEEIFFQMTEKSFEYEDELKETLSEYLANISPEAYESKEFSNARFMRNLYERVWGKAAYRISFSEDKAGILKVKDMKAALEEDMFASLIERKQEKRIGFAVN